MIWFEGSHGDVSFAFTDRSGGTSEGPWGSLNLGTSNGDDPARVADNLALVGGAVGADRLVRMTQVHGNDVVWADAVADGDVPVADALLTDRPGTAVLVRVADCTPVVLAGQGVAAVVHCGREGLVKG
ncbi:laccase domain-containing protein, partial [Aeromicrobium fastidiosum]|uniref:laccase domain-containing protein n=1 Tax=Aeromicrobium fastidiosum TaxID=52699 RepID=UPI0020233717